MANAFVLAHGTRDAAAEWTFVPPDRSISFYAQFDENLVQAIGWAALNAGSIEPAETYPAGERVPNYYLARHTDDEIMTAMSAVSSVTGGTVYFVGQSPLTNSPTYLCTTLDACLANYPDHATGCQGVFALISEDDIFGLNCTGTSGAAGQTETLEGERDFINDLDDLTARILAWKDTEPQAAMDYYETLPSGTQAVLRGASFELQRWLNSFAGERTPAAIVDARGYLESHGDVAYYTYVEQMDMQQRSMVLEDDALLTAFWLGYGRSVLQRDGAPALYEWWRTLDQPWLDTIAGDDELGPALGQGSQGADVADAPAWAPSDDDLATAQELNEAFVKSLDEDVDASWEIGGALLLLGQPSSDLASRVRQQSDYQSGTFQVERATFGAGSVLFTGVAPVLQDTVTWSIGQFSRKDVKFQ